MLRIWSEIKLVCSCLFLYFPLILLPFSLGQKENKVRSVGNKIIGKVGLKAAD